MVTDVYDPHEHGPLATDAERLLLLVRRMNAAEFAGVFRHDLAASELMRVVTSLPTDRLNHLMDRARRPDPPAPPETPDHPRHTKQSLASAIRTARKQAGMLQVELAAALGVRQSSVSQWERGSTEPSTQKLLDLMRVLPGVAEALSAAAARRAGAGQPGPAAGMHG